MKINVELPEGYTYRLVRSDMSDGYRIWWELSAYVDDLLVAVTEFPTIDQFVRYGVISIEQQIGDWETGGEADFDEVPF